MRVGLGLGSGAGWPARRARALSSGPLLHPRPQGAHLNFELVPREMHVDPRLEGLVLHALACGLTRAAMHLSHMHTVVCTFGVWRRTSACALPVSPWSPCRGKVGWLAQWTVQWGGA